MTRHVGLFIPLPPELADQFPSREGHDDSPSHVTFLYVGDVPPDRQAEFVSLIRGVVYEDALTAPVRGTLDRLEHFDTPKDGRVAVMRVLFNRDMTVLRGRVVRALRAARFEIADHSPDVWRAHSTLEYLGDVPNAMYGGVLPQGSWTFDRMEVWGLGQNYVVPLARTVASRVASRWLARRF